MQNAYNFHVKIFAKVCEIKFEIYGAHENWLHFKKEERGVFITKGKSLYFCIQMNNSRNFFFQASKSLDVYEVIHEVLYTTSSPYRKSQAVVKMVFKRRVEYHVGHTFLEVSNCQRD